jgi:mono/diheme cytochrome c family protein
MSRRAANILLLLVFFVLLGMNWMARRDPTRPNREFLPEMVRTARYNAYAPNPNFPDGKTLQAPPPGTIPRGYPPLHYSATPQDAIRAGLELHNPFAGSDAAALQRGAAVFANFCQPCHGGGGKGDGPVAMRGYPPPPSLLAPHALHLPEGQIFHILTYGQNNMPSYASQLSREDRWKVINYIRALQSKNAAQSSGAER